MKAIVYVKDDIEPSINSQFNRCSRYAAKNNLVIDYTFFDIGGNRFQDALDKAIDSDDTKHIIIYNRKTISTDPKEVLFYHFYFMHFGLEVHFVS